MRFKFVLWWTCNSTRTQAPCHTWLDESLWNDKRHSFVSITLLCTTMSGEDTPRWIYSTVKMPPTCLLFLYKTKGEILPGGEKQHATSLQRQTGKGAAAQHDMTAIDWLNDIYMQRLWRHNQHACFKCHGKLSNMTMYLEQLTSS